jgi:hypothetical protein
MVCTYGDQFSVREQLFMSAVGPRGIIPASVATLFALELRPTDPEAATVLVGTVFLVILTTVVFQAGFARHIAQALNVLPMRVIVIGGGRVGRGLAKRLEDRGENVIIVEENQEQVEEARTPASPSSTATGLPRRTSEPPALTTPRSSPPRRATTT